MEDFEHLHNEINRYKNMLVQKQNEEVMINRKLSINEAEKLQLIDFIETLKELLPKK
jgi:hypothetical protein